MSWAGVITAIKTNCTSAGTDVTPNITHVRVGVPDSLTQDTIAIWPSGTRSPGNTFGQLHLERGVQVTAYVRGSIRAGAIDETLEAKLVAVEAALFTRLWADGDCGGNAIAIAIEGSTYDWGDLGDQVARVVTFTGWVWLENG